MTVFFTVLAAFAIQATAPKPVEADIAWVASGEFCEPETVLPLPDNTLLVSNVCNFRETGNGFLTLLDVKGNVVDWRLVEGLDAPLGMALLKDRIFIVDNNRVKILSWPGYQLLETIELSTAVANDIAVSADGEIYVTDTVKGQVIAIQPDGEQSVFTGKEQFPGANGIALYQGDLYVGGERLWRVSLGSHSVETIGPEWVADIDGIEFEADGTLQVTPVGGALIRFSGENEVEILAGEGISSANHGYDPTSGLALIPTGFDNTVIAIRISSQPR